MQVEHLRRGIHMNTTKRIAQLIALVLFLVIGLLIVMQNIALADTEGTEAIAPARIVDIYAVKFDGHGFLTIVLDNLAQPLDDDGSCEGRLTKVVYQFYPTLGEPVIQPISPEQPVDRPGCEADYQAVSQFAASLHLFMGSEGESVLVGPIMGLFTEWPALYQYILSVEHDAMYTHQTTLPIVINQ
jgi:hypothetical protein